jgi:hypothetical protein
MSDFIEGTDAGNVEVHDPDDLHRIRRVRAIHDARERFVKVRLQTRDMMITEPTFAQSNVDKYAIMTALDYLRELEPMVRRSDSQLLEHKVEIPSKPFPSESIPTSHKSVYWDDGSLRTDPVELTLNELLNSAGTIRASATVKGRNAGTNSRVSKDIEITVTAGERVAMNIVRLCDDFLEDALPSIGQAADSEAGFDYSDLI